MRACVQRVSKACVKVDDKIVGEIGIGLLVFLVVEKGDVQRDADYMAEKISGLRIFSDDDGKMNLSLAEISGRMLVVSQFTLLGDCRKGRRPSFIGAAQPETGNELYEYFVTKVNQIGIETETGIFQEDMDVSLVNDGPVTLLIDSKKLF